MHCTTETLVADPTAGPEGTHELISSSFHFEWNEFKGEMHNYTRLYFIVLSSLLY